MHDLNTTGYKFSLKCNIFNINWAYRVDLPGGPLQIEWREEDGHVMMTGPATLVFAGSLEPDALNSKP